MRLHRLELSAFGPFAGTEVVDLDDVGSAGLFLLHGPTGAGKTTVLDAVCFALFGQVPGSRGSGRQRLRSDHAPADRWPQVVLELTVAGRRLEVTRSPEWQRPKRRGSGTTKEQASTTVRELVDGEWRPLTSRNDEAGHLLTRLVGMGVEQFTKVVLLPQGEFAAFLRADAETRRVLLSRLFDIDLYTDVEGWLADERRRLARDVEVADQRTATLVSRAVEASTGLPAGDGDEILDETKPLLVVDRLLQRAEVASRAGESELVLREEHLAAARHALAAGTETAGLQERWSLAADRLRQLDAEAPRVQHDRRWLDAARRAAPVGPLLAARGDALVRWHEAATSALRLVDAPLLGEALADSAPAVASDHLAAVHERLVAQLPDASARDADRSSLQRRAAVVEAALQRGQTHVGLRETTGRLAAAVASAHESRCRVELDLSHARNALELAAARLDVARTELPDLASREDAVERARSAWQHACDAASLTDQVAAAHVQLREAVDVDQHAREHVLKVRERRLDGIAAELALQLRPGCPCPVCGSAEHPSPSRATDEQVDRAAEEAATDVADAARAARDAAAASLAGLQSRLAEAVALSGGLTEALARTALEAAELQLHQARECHRRLADATAAHDEATAQTDTLLSRLGALTQQRSTAEAELAEAKGRLHALEQHLHTVLSDALRSASDERDAAAVVPEVIDVAETMERLQALQRQCHLELERLRMLSGARLELDAAHDDHEALATRTRATAAACGFADVGEAEAALLPSDAVEELAESLAAYDAGQVEVRAELGRPEVLEASTRPAPDLVRLQEDVAAADGVLRRATAASAVAERSTSSLRRIKAELAAHELRSDDVRQHHARVDELSRCVDGTGGGNAFRMRLSAYVLAARLEQVAAAATERLDVMSGGRYALVHSDEVAKGGVRSGLALRVVDGWTGVERATTTLSGGESFLASLALALGLADVVQAESGGASIETLFVDEGFGTLDDETLDEVMTVLDGLRDGGRTVGVVSHVAELRHRIPSRIEVVKRRDGSRLLVHDTCA